MFDRIIVSTDENPMFLQFVPLVSKAWSKFFPDKKLSIAFISDKNENDPLITKMKSYGDVVIFPPIKGIPSANQAKISRHILATQYPEEICMIEDIDTIPLQVDFFKERTSYYKENSVVVVGMEVYKGTPHEGKFPMSTMTTKGKTFKSIVNPNNLGYVELLNSFVGTQVYDYKENISNPPEKFSDESLMRVLLNNWGGNIIKVDRNVDIKKDWIDRSWWDIDLNRLQKEEYITCNFLRPFKPNYDRIKPIVEFIYNKPTPQHQVLLEDTPVTPLRILLIQENGRHDKNRYFRECFCLQRGLTLLGHKADVWGLNHDSWPTQPDFEAYDLILNLENYQETAGSWVPDLSQIKTTKFLWSIDAHCKGVGPYDKDFERGNYNLLLHSTKDYVTLPNRVWFPNAYDDTLIFPMDVEKKCDIGFVGNTVNRASYINFLQQKFNFKFDNFVIGEDMVKALNSYKVSWNKNIANDINYRSFETIGCGIPLVTNYNPQYEELGFTHGENVAMYTDLESMVQCIEALIQNNELREKIATNGLGLAKKHTYLERCKLLVQIYEEHINGQSITGFKL